MKCCQYYCFVILGTVLGSIITHDNFVNVKSDYVIRTGGGLLQKRSVIECSKACLKGAVDCGFNYHRHNRQCACVTSYDLQGMAMEAKSGASVYIHGRCTQAFQAQLQASTTETVSTSTTTTTSRITALTQTPASTSTQLSTTTTTSPVTSTLLTTTTQTSTTSTTAPETLTTTTTTPQTSTTTTTTPQTSTTTTTTPQTSTTTTTTPQTSTTTTTTPQTSTIIEKPQISTTTTTKPQTSTTTAMTVPNTLATTVSNVFSTINTMPVIATTITSVSACVPEALLCQSGSVRLFSSSRVFTYSSYAHLTSDSLSTDTVISLFPMTSENVIAAYADSTFVYLITEDDQVHKYENGGPNSFIQKKSLDDHFRGKAPADIDDVIYTSDNDMYMFHDDKVHIIKASYNFEEIRLDNNGNKNVYKSDNFNDRPKAIKAACEIDADTHVFISDGSVYMFFFSTTKWKNVGRLKC